MVSGLNVMVNVGHCRHLLVHVQLLHYPPLTATYTLIGHAVSQSKRGWIDCCPCPLPPTPTHAPLPVLTPPTSTPSRPPPPHLLPGTASVMQVEV